MDNKVWKGKKKKISLPPERSDTPMGKKEKKKKKRKKKEQQQQK